MNRTTSLLIAVSVLVLGGAWLASRALTGDVAPPPMPAVVEPTLVVTPPPVAPTRAPAPVVVVPPSVAPAVLATPHAAEPVVAAPPQPYVKPARELPPLPDPERSETEQEAASLGEDAWRMINAPDTGPANWARAAKSFRRCLAMTPDNDRCKSGLEAAQKRIGAPPPPGGPKVRLPHPSSTDEE